MPLANSVLAERIAAHLRGMNLERSLGEVDRQAQERIRTARLLGPCRDLLDFTLRTYPQYTPQWFHHVIASELDAFIGAVERQERPRLAIFVPPRHGKSELASIRLPAYVLGRHPDWFIIHASYTADLSNDFSRQVRDVLRTPEYRELFPATQLSQASSAVHRWGVEGRRGFFVSTGVGGPLTGRGAHILIIDDPVKEPRDADSETFRKAQRDWYDAAARTRLEKGGGILLIQTRWHEADLSGYVTEGKGADSEAPPAEMQRWRIVRLPAVAERDETFTAYPGTGRERHYERRVGDPLWPEKYSREELEETRNSIASRWWLSLYQQRPTAEGGNFFEMDKLRHGTREPGPTLRIYQAWDLAISEKTSADYTCCVTIGVDRDQNVFVMDVFRRRLNFNAMLAEMERLGMLWRPTMIGIESGGFQSTAFQEACRRYALPFRELIPDRDKETRAQLLSARISASKVYVNQTAPWWRTLEDEMTAFPASEHDDQVDALAYALILAFQFPSTPAPLVIQPDDSFYSGGGSLLE